MSHPFLLELNTRCWLNDLARREGRPITLANIPFSEFELWQAAGLTHIWLMGVWQGGPQAREVALRDPQQREVCEALPDWTEADVASSPYAIASYSVSERLGGEAALQTFRGKLRGYGLKLILDFVPNHLGLDHAWIEERPGLFVQQGQEAPGFFRAATGAGVRWLAHGRDPYFPPWTDTVQLDYRLAQVHEAMKEQLFQISAQCDGLRCDMAMLLLKDVFGKTWQGLPALGPSTEAEFWGTTILRDQTSISGLSVPC